jgi:hypothetical protein
VNVCVPRSGRGGLRPPPTGGGHERHRRAVPTRTGQGLRETNVSVLTDGGGHAAACPYGRLAVHQVCHPHWHGEYGDTIRSPFGTTTACVSSGAPSPVACHMVSPHSGAGRSETAPYGCGS